MIQGHIDASRAKEWDGRADLPVPVAVRAGRATTTLVPLSAVDAALLQQWQTLVEQSADRNVFAEPWLLLAGMRHCLNTDQVRLALVRDSHNRLIGLFAVDRIAGIGRLPLPGWALWRHPNAFLAPGIAARGCEAAAWSALVDLLGSARPNAACLLADGIVEGSALHAGLVAAAGQRRLPLDTDHRFERAMLASDLPPDAYWDAAVRAKKRKELRRQWARLAEEGALTTGRLTPDAEIAPWADEFFALEASGWKGANGSALSSNADTHAFFASALRDGHAAGKVAITALRLDSRAIAMLVTLLSGSGGFSFKTAFDETYSRFSPGVLLQRESLDIAAAHSLDWIDSCAAPDHPMIDSLWRERRAILRLTLPLPGAANKARFAATMTAQRLWHQIKQWRPTPAAPVTGDDQP
jgi:CelD/BcsL family acetyltransferase involved in cellulose biosynthesis